MKLTVAEKLGGLTAIIADDLRTANIEGIGERVSISWCNMRPEHPVVNYIEPYGKEEIANLNKILKEKGLKEVKPKERVKISFTNEQKEALYAEVKRQYQQFFDDLMAGKIPVKINIVGCDWPHPVLHVDDQPQYGIKTWDLYYHLFAEKYHIYENLKFIPNEKQKEGTDVTTEVIVRIKEIEGIRITEQAEAAKRQAELEAAKAAMNVKVLKEGKISGGDGPDYYADIEITDPATGESAKFCCRNIFDFGYVVNPAYAVAEGLEPGGLARKVKKSELDSTITAYAVAGIEVGEAEEDEVWCWQDYHTEKGWYVVRPMTMFEVKAYQYLHKFSPVCKGIRI